MFLLALGPRPLRLRKSPAQDSALRRRQTLPVQIAQSKLPSSLTVWLVKHGLPRGRDSRFAAEPPLRLPGDAEPSPPPSRKARPRARAAPSRGASDRRPGASAGADAPSDRRGGFEAPNPRGLADIARNASFPAAEVELAELCLQGLGPRVDAGVPGPEGARPRSTATTRTTSSRRARRRSRGDSRSSSRSTRGASTPSARCSSWWGSSTRPPSRPP